MVIWFLWRAHDVHCEFFNGLMPWLILIVRGWFFHHDVMDSLDTQFSGSLWQWWGDSARLVPGLVWRSWFHLVLTLWLCECRPRGSSCRRWILWCHRWLGNMVEWEFLALIYLLSVCRCWRFVLDPVVAEASLTFAWCTWLSSWCMKMVRSWGLIGFLVIFIVCGDGSSWYVEMVASWGLMGFLVKVWFMLSFDILSLVWRWFHFYVMVYSWYVFRVVTCYSMFIWSMLSLLVEMI